MDLNIDIKELMTRINELVEKKVIEIELKKNSSSKLEEYINLDLENKSTQAKYLELILQLGTIALIC